MQVEVERRCSLCFDGVAGCGWRGGVHCVLMGWQGAGGEAVFTVLMGTWQGVGGEAVFTVF